MPLLALKYEKPSEGWPLYHSWIGTAKDIFFRGYEAWREIVEVRLSQAPDGPLDYASVVPTKGLGRVSIILWAVFHSYVKLRGEMSQEQVTDFKRCLWHKSVALGRVKSQDVTR